MAAWIERLLLRWLRAVAPPEWFDSVLGDLREDDEIARRRGRAGTHAHLARIAARFTADAAVLAWHERPHGGRMTTLANDARQAVRSLRHSPAFTIVAVLTLALAIGANTAIYSVLSSLVLQPLPLPDGHRYVFIWHKNPEMGGLLLAPPQVAINRWRQATHVFETIESYASRNVVLTGAGEPEAVSLTALRPSTLATLGVAPLLGRPIGPGDTAADAPAVVLISHAVWTSRFGRDRDITGRTLRLDDTLYTIIGVMPRRFELPLGSSVLWTAARPGVTENENTIAKLAPGVTVAQAQAALDTFGSPGGEFAGSSGQIVTPADNYGTQVRPALFVLSGAVGLLLLIACVNVANLLLSRHSIRRREIATRHALGASRGRLMRLLLLESAIVAAAGGLAGLAIAHLGLEAMVALRPSRLAVLERVELDAPALWFAAAVSALTALLCGLAPAITASRVHLQDVLKSGGRSATPAGQRVRRVLTAAQVALAVMLLVGASLLLRSYAKLTAVEPGYDPSGVLVMRVSLTSSRYPPQQRQAFFDQAVASIRTLPGVVEAAAGSGVPPDSGSTFGQLEIDGRPDPNRRSGVFGGGFVSPTYFATLAIPVLEGRVFSDDDVLERDRVVVLGASTAALYFPGESPIGQRVRLNPNAPWATVVGVVGDVKAFNLSSPREWPQLYQARAQWRPGYGAIVIRAAGDPEALVPAVKARIWALDPRLPLREIVTADQLLARSVSQSRFNMALLVSFAGCGLLLAVVGVYGVTSLFVGQRQREVGIRMALGATRGAVAALVVRQTALVLAFGIAFGGAGAVWLSRFMRDLVFGVATTDVASFLLPALAIALAAGAATLVPLRRATTVDPAVVLRGE
jgi:putative ABC transport system permease protein